MSNITVNITTGTFFKAILITGLFVLLYLLSDLVLVLLTAVVIASAIEPAAQWFIKLRIPRILAVIFIYLALAIILFGVFYFFLPPLLDDIVGLLSSLPQYVETLNPLGFFWW